MSAYYNENDKFAAAWLRELIKAGLIAEGEVDERSIKEVQPVDLVGYTQCHFFAGIGGWSYALRLAVWPDERPVWTGSCPCQPFSVAGKRGGAGDDRHLWPDFFRLISQCRPPIVFGEQVASKDGLAWLDLVSTDLEGAGYAVGAADLCAAGVQAPHIRQRLWFMAESECWSAERQRYDMATAQSSLKAEAQERQRIRDDARDGLATRQLADSSCERIDRTLRHDRCAGASRGESQQESVVDRTPRQFADATSRGEKPAQQSRQRSSIEQDGGVGHAVQPGLQEQRSQPRISCETGGGTKGQAVERAGPSTFWVPCDWLPCRDGKVRPVESGLEPLVAGLPRGVVPSGDTSEAYANYSPEARIERLRGYGNAIVPPVAQAFIDAYLTR